MRVHVAAILTFSVVITAIAGLRAQESQTFRGRLSPVPISADMASRITGSGSMTAQLSGTTLTIAGLFTGLQSPATLAHVHIGPLQAPPGRPA